MIEGIGVDVVDIPRLEKAVGNWGDTFLQKVFTAREIRYARSKKDPYPHMAARFAVKEAVAKALATGWSGGFRWKDVEVENNAAGKPTVILYGKLKEMLASSKVVVSISHSEHVVVAIAVIER